MSSGEENSIPPLKQVVEKAEKNAILSALRITRNNRTEAARKLNISRRVLYYKLEAYGLMDIIRKADASRKKT